MDFRFFLSFSSFLNPTTFSLHQKPCLFFLTFVATLLCFVLALSHFTSRSFPKSRRKPSDSTRNSTASAGPVAAVVEEEGEEEEEMVEKAAVVAAAVEKQSSSGASMMEQLVPEITTHALSYLDYPSLCRLSMTNSLMRKAANDDNAWKALYHKDFTLEQDSVTPVNGWKSYYAATRAIVNINSEFFSIIREKSLPSMRRMWLNADYVKCIHASGELFSGYNAVMQSWQIAFSWDQGLDFQVRDVRARVLTDMAWVTMKTFVDMETGPFNVTNVYEFHNGRWYMVHHHSSLMVGDAEPPQNGHA